MRVFYVVINTCLSLLLFSLGQYGFPLLVAGVHQQMQESGYDTIEVCTLSSTIGETVITTR